MTFDLGKAGEVGFKKRRGEQRERVVKVKNDVWKKPKKGGEEKGKGKMFPRSLEEGKIHDPPQ